MSCMGQHLERTVCGHFPVNISSWLLSVVKSLVLVATMVFSRIVLFRSEANPLPVSFVTACLCLLLVGKLIFKSKTWKPLFSKGSSIVAVKNVCLVRNSYSSYSLNFSAPSFFSPPAWFCTFGDVSRGRYD